MWGQELFSVLHSGGTSLVERTTTVIMHRVVIVSESQKRLRTLGTVITSETQKRLRALGTSIQELMYSAPFLAISLETLEQKEWARMV